jgi:hypothetical protein
MQLVPKDWAPFTPGGASEMRWFGSMQRRFQPRRPCTRRDGFYEDGEKEPKKLTVRGPAADDPAEQGGNVKPAAMPFENDTDELWRQSIVCAQ